jgi:hypothetical protein
MADQQKKGASPQMTTKRDLAWVTFIARLRQDVRSDVVYWRHEKGQTVLTAEGHEFVVTDSDLFGNLDDSLERARAWLDGLA